MLLQDLQLKCYSLVLAVARSLLITMLTSLLRHGTACALRTISYDVTLANSVEFLSVPSKTEQLGCSQLTVAE